MKNMSGRIIARIQRAAVAKARPAPATPALNRSEGRDIPCQLPRNSSINFTMGRTNQSSKPNQAGMKYARQRCQAWLALGRQTGG
ncbi:MAG: hypothetical protein NVS2B1_04150 [Bradyrhizobium sp.]